MKIDLIIGSICSCSKIIVISLLAMILISGCGDDGDSPFKASDGEYGIGDDNDTGGYLEVIDNNIYNLRLSMSNPPTDDSCLTITGGSVTRPGESEPFMEFVAPIITGSIQEIIYFGPIEIDGDGKFIVEESISATPPLCGQAFTISGTFQDRDHIVGRWIYTIAEESTSGTWGAELYVAHSYLEPILLPTVSIVIDGDRSDWQGIQPIISDKEDDENPDADFDGTDLKALYLARDNEFLYHMITLHDDDPPVDRNLVYSINYNKYPGNSGDSVPGDQASAVFLSYPPDGDMVVDFGDDSNGIYRYSPDYAAIGNKFLEYKIPLEDMKSIHDKFPNIYAHMLEVDDDGLLIYQVSDDIVGTTGIIDSGGGYSK